MSRWKCDECAEAEGGSGLPCIFESPTIKQSTELRCPVSGQPAEFVWIENNDGLTGRNVVHAVVDDPVLVLNKDKETLIDCSFNQMPTEYQNARLCCCACRHEVDFPDCQPMCPHNIVRTKYEVQEGNTNCGCMDPHDITKVMESGAGFLRTEKHP